MRYRISILFSMVVLLGLLAGSVTAQEVVDVPTWFVGYSWSYTETGNYSLSDGTASIQLTENYTWIVTRVTDDTYELSKAGTLTGTVRYSIISAPLENGRSEGTLVVKRSNLGIVRETQIRSGNLLGGNVRLEFTLSDNPTIKTYDFPIFDGFGFTAGTTKTLSYSLTGSVLGIDLSTLVPPGSQSLALSLTTTVAAQDTGFQVVTTADQYSASITDLYDPSIKSYRQEVWDIQVPGLGRVTQTKNLTGTPNVPDAPAQLAIAGADSESPFVTTGEVVFLSGTGWLANSMVTIRQPETSGASWTAQTDADGQFTTSFTVAAGMFRDTVQSDFVASVGLVAQGADNTAAVATLVVVQ